MGSNDMRTGSNAANASTCVSWASQIEDGRVAGLASVMNQTSTSRGSLSKCSEVWAAQLRMIVHPSPD